MLEKFRTLWYPRKIHVNHGSIDRSGNFRGGGCSLIVTSSNFESDRLGRVLSRLYYIENGNENENITENITGR